MTHLNPAVMVSHDLRMDENKEYHKQEYYKREYHKRIKSEVNQTLKELMLKVNSAKCPQQFRIKLQEAQFWFNYHE